MTPGQLAELLGEPPTPEGDWTREAVYLSAAALRRRVDPGELAASVPGAVALPNGLLRIVLPEPADVLADVFAVPDQGWPEAPLTWDNPGFVVRYARARAVSVTREAPALGVPGAGEGTGGLGVSGALGVPGGLRVAGGFEAAGLSGLSGVRDRAVLRVLAELPGRQVSAEPGWAAFLVRLALAYHDAYEQAAPLPVGDEPASEVHTARVRLALAVQEVLPGPDRI
ncbi:anticodon-binding protein [Nonomuraea endophytica]|uniref:Arginyl-tRNA synthetase n=1 Tax=Nonomuraea endophytica TaxID=714136 RepID=A0A7W8EHY1_9ACTN|nr:anticodon-binding protein [Nonomuraea endophytica]MBB5079973.1 arginyl-tRNA synthetase [Nonomuraea endophytica]